MVKLKLTIFISGRGSNMHAILDACQKDDFPAEVIHVISNKPEAKGLNLAKEYGIETTVVSHKDFGSKAAFENALFDAVPQETDIICLAGFMRILSADFISRWPGDILNIHPSLLPDYKGLDTHRRVLEDGRTETGCTVHYVVSEVDSGEIIVQKSVAVHEGDTESSLSLRVLEQEHIAYPEAIESIAKKA